MLFFFFFKQKTAYEMRISACSADVGSSDLSRLTWAFGAALAVAGAAHGSGVEIQVWHTLSGPNKAEFEKLAKKYNKEQNDVVVELRDFSRSEGSRVGKECVSTCSSRWSQYH